MMKAKASVKRSLQRAILFGRVYDGDSKALGSQGFPSNQGKRPYDFRQKRKS